MLFTIGLIIWVVGLLTMFINRGESYFEYENFVVGFWICVIGAIITGVGLL